MNYAAPMPVQVCDHGPADDTEVFHKITIEDRDTGTRTIHGSFRCKIHPGFSGNFKLVEVI